jgi:hypothetical protein
MEIKPGTEVTINNVCHGYPRSSIGMTGIVEWSEDGLVWVKLVKENEKERMGMNGVMCPEEKLTIIRENS